MNREVVETAANAADGDPAASGDLVASGGGDAAPTSAAAEAALPGLDDTTAEPPSHISVPRRAPSPLPLSILKDTSSIFRDSQVESSKTPTSANFLNASNKRPRSPESDLSTIAQYKGEGSDSKRKRSNRLRWKEGADLVEIRIFEKTDKEEEDDTDGQSRLSHQDEGEMLRKPRPILEWYNPIPLVIPQEYLERRIVSEEEELGRPLLAQTVICACPEEIEPDLEQLDFAQHAMGGLGIQKDYCSNGQDLPQERTGDENRLFSIDGEYRYNRDQSSNDRAFQERFGRDSYGGDNGWGGRQAAAASSHFLTEEEQLSLKSRSISNPTTYSSRSEDGSNYNARRLSFNESYPSKRGG